MVGGIQRNKFVSAIHNIQAVLICIHGHAGRVLAHVLEGGDFLALLCVHHPDYALFSHAGNVQTVVLFIEHHFTRMNNIFRVFGFAQLQYRQLFTAAGID